MITIKERNEGPILMNILTVGPENQEIEKALDPLPEHWRSREYRKEEP